MKLIKKNLLKELEKKQSKTGLIFKIIAPAYETEIISWKTCMKKIDLIFTGTIMARI
jgi:hypothetical protein